MNVTRKAIGTLGLVGAVILMEGTGWSQCAMCRTALENSAEGQAIAEGFRYGIVFLLAAPYAIAGSVAVGLVRALRKRDKAGD